MTDDFQSRVSETATRLERWCREQGHFITADGAVYEETAALILDRKPGTLRNWRTDDAQVVPYYRSSRGARVRYRLADMAKVIEAQRLF